MKVALDGNRRRVEKVFGLVEAIMVDEGVDVGSESGWRGRSWWRRGRGRKL